MASYTSACVYFFFLFLLFFWLHRRIIPEPWLTITEDSSTTRQALLVSGSHCHLHSLIAFIFQLGKRRHREAGEAAQSS